MQIAPCRTRSSLAWLRTGRGQHCPRLAIETDGFPLPLLIAGSKNPAWSLSVGPPVALSRTRSSLSHVRSQGQTVRRFSLGSTAAFDPRRT